MLINLMVRILSQCIQISNHHDVVYFKYITVLFINYSSVNLEKNKGRQREGKRERERELKKVTKLSSPQILESRV